MRFFLVTLLHVMFLYPLSNLGYAATTQAPISATTQAPISATTQAPISATTAASSSAISPTISQKESKELSSTDVFLNLSEGFDGREILTKFLPSHIQPAGVTLVNKNKYDISYQVQWECAETMSKGRLNVGGVYIFKQTHFVHPSKICVKTEGASSILGSGGWTRINNVAGCVVVTVDAGSGFGVKNIYSKECRGEAKASSVPIVGTASDSNGVWVINDNSWAVNLYISPADATRCYVFDDMRSRLGASIDPVITPGLNFGLGLDIIINPTDPRIVHASIGPSSAYYFERSLRHQTITRDIRFSNPIVCVAAKGETNFGYRFNAIGSDHPVNKKGCYITVTDKGAGKGVDLGYTGTCAPTAPAAN